MSESLNPLVLKNQVFCPICKRYSQFLRIDAAAKAANVSRRTIYNYLEEGAVHSIRLAGKTTRVCVNSLLGQASFPQAPPFS